MARSARHRPLAVLLILQALHALLVWRSGSLWGTWSIECNVGAVAWDFAHGPNPQLSPFDYFPRYATGYLLSGLLVAPLTWFVSAATAIKVGALATNAGILTLAWLFLEKHAGAAAARVGGACLVFAPPLLAAYSTQAGNFHWTELLPTLAMLVLAGEVALGRQRLAWPLGLVAGLAISTSFGAAAYVVAVLGFLFLAARASLLRTLPGLLIGAAPLAWKLLVHRPPGQAQIGGSALYVRAELGGVLEKAADAFLDTGASLAFADGWHGVLPLGLGERLGDVWLWGVLAALALVLAQRRRELVELVSGLRRGIAVESRHVQLLLPLCVLAFVAAFLLSDQSVLEARGLDAQLRNNRFLPSPLALAALLPGLAVAAMPRLLVPALLLPVLCLGSWIGPIHWSALPGDGLDYRGRCYDLFGLYGGETVADPLGPEQGWRVCEGFAEPEECWRGWLWSVGQSQLVDEDGWRLSEAGQRMCASLPEDAAPDCWRHAGWAITMRELPAGGDAVGRIAAACAGLPESCQEGYGFYLADHFGYAPWKLDALVARDAPSPLLAAAWYRGAGHLLRHELTLEGARAACGRLGGAAPCLQGLDAAFRLPALPVR